ncbi:DUF1918 domain-containing protein [Nocardia sp. 348MFTsu5.1]|uniref:DUF1918 domain-containing protein n=1 Tax=Nocardia sp. 348MFTsu5.1 TaxID=1172185 RepID=UPI0003A09F7D|nr:DUF1918 domain-containing protein [Nocardia sp. 348MFTsu5.1]
MHAKVGDWLVVKGTVLDTPDHFGQILEVHSPNGEPPYVVHWTHSDVDAVVVPGPDARVITPEEHEHEAQRRQDRISEIERNISQHHPHSSSSAAPRDKET